MIYLTLSLNFVLDLFHLGKPVLALELEFCALPLFMMIQNLNLQLSKLPKHFHNTTIFFYG